MKNAAHNVRKYHHLTKNPQVFTMLPLDDEN